MINLYDLLSIYDNHFEFVIQDKNGKIVECFTVKEGKSLPNHKLFDKAVLAHLFTNKNHKLIVRLDYAE